MNHRAPDLSPHQVPLSVRRQGDLSFCRHWMAGCWCAPPDLRSQRWAPRPSAAGPRPQQASRRSRAHGAQSEAPRAGQSWRQVGGPGGSPSPGHGRWTGTVVEGGCRADPGAGACGAPQAQLRRARSPPRYGPGGSLSARRHRPRAGVPPARRRDVCPGQVSRGVGPGSTPLGMAALSDALKEVPTLVVVIPTTPEQLSRCGWSRATEPARSPRAVPAG